MNQIMGSPHYNSAILADRHVATSEGIRGLLETEFDTVYLVANTHSLTEGVARLKPRLVVLDQSFGPETTPELLDTVHAASPDSWVIVLTLRDQVVIADAMLAAGANAVVIKRCAGTDLFEALVAIEGGKRYQSPGFGPVPEPDQALNTGSNPHSS
jgi:DNA-binding NarL/FixJ family response regulator